MHKTIFFSHLCIRIHSDFCFEIVFLYTFFSQYRCDARLFFWYFHMLFWIFIKNWRYYNNFTRADTTSITIRIVMCCNRKGGQMDDNDHSISFLTRCSCFEQQVSWRSVWCCLKSQGHTILWSTVWTVFGFYVLHAWFFFRGQRKGGGQNFVLKMSWVDFGITFFLKTKKKLKSIEDGSLVVFVFKNLIGWNTVLVIWKIHIGRIVQSLLFSLKLYRVNQKKCLIGLLFHPVNSYSKCTAFWDGNNNTTEKFNFKYKILCWNVW